MRALAGRDTQHFPASDRERRIHTMRSILALILALGPVLSLEAAGLDTRPNSSAVNDANPHSGIRPAAAEPSSSPDVVIAVGSTGADARDIGALDVSAADGTSAAQQNPPMDAMLILPFKEVRLKTVPPLTGSAKLLHQDGTTVTVELEDGGEPVTRTKPEHYLHGEVEAIEGDRLVLSVKGGSTVAVRQSDVMSIESRHPASPGRAVVGGLVGVAGGFLAAVLGCATVDGFCDSTVPLWVGTVTGMAIGAGAGAAPDWKPASVVPKRRVGLSLQPKRGGGAAAALTLEF
jgi:hypothetical protein